MVDIHCHILPGVDDGPSSWDTAVEMCQLAADDGITHIVATPHANEVYAYDHAHNLETLDRLQRLSGGRPALSLGCDFRFSPENLQALRTDRTPFMIAGTDYMLVELSDFAVPPNFGQSLLHLISTGIRPVLTHPERHPLLQQRPEQVLEWVDMGCIVQVTANTFSGRWGKSAQKTVRWLLEHDAVHVVATDAHGTDSRPPVLSNARQIVAEWHSEEVATALVEDNPGAIVRGCALPYFPEVAS